jgi:hypothetical protein
MPNNFGDRFKAAVQKDDGRPDLSGYTIDDLFPPTTKSAGAPFTGREDTAGEKLAKAISGNREENTDGH